MRRLFDLYVHQSLGAGEIAKQLNDEACLTRKGKRWTKQALLKMLRRTVYVGSLVYNRMDAKEGIERPKHEWIYIDVPAIVPMETFNMAQERLGEFPWGTCQGTTPTSSLLLSGMVYCAKCGEKMISGRGGGGRYAYYVCSTYKNKTKQACGGVGHIPIEKLHAAVLDTVARKVLSEERVLQMSTHIRKVREVESHEIDKHRRALRSAKAKLDKYHSAFEAGELEPQLLNARLRDLRDEVAHHESEIERLRACGKPGRAEVLQTADKIRNAILSHENPRLIRRYLSQLVEKVVVDGKTATVAARSMDGFLPRVTEWQPVGDSNPCDRTENPAS